MAGSWSKRVGRCMHISPNFESLNKVCRVDAEWIVAKKDWEEAKKRQKSQDKQRTASLGKNGRKSASAPTVTTPEEEEGSYDADMDEMRCILYTHGGEFKVSGFRTLLAQYEIGGYYFGSVDQERYAIQRFARKVNGRVFGMLLYTPRFQPTHKFDQPSIIV